MHVTQLEWIITLGVTIAVLLFDVIVIGRRPHEPSKRETGTALAIYIGLAVAFGLWTWFYHGSQFGLDCSGPTNRETLVVSRCAGGIGVAVHLDPCVLHSR